jgi:hypothetical protein
VSVKAPPPAALPGYGLDRPSRPAKIAVPKMNVMGAKKLALEEPTRSAIS